MGSGEDEIGGDQGSTTDVFGGAPRQFQLDWHLPRPVSGNRVITAHYKANLGGTHNSLSAAWKSGTSEY